VAVLRMVGRCDRLPPGRLGLLPCLFLAPSLDGAERKEEKREKKEEKRRITFFSANETGLCLVEGRGPAGEKSSFPDPRL